jgi:hypothetical protein
MNIVVKIGSFFAAAVLIIVSFVSVVGYQSVQPNKEDSLSPLFSIRIQRALNRANERSMTSDYLGKGKTLCLFTSSHSMFLLQFDRAYRIINNNPALVQKYLEKLSKSPQIKRIFQQYGSHITDIKQVLAQIKDNPKLLKNQLNKIVFPADISGSSQPLGLDTSSAIGCFITVLILLPLAIVIGTLIATITLVTCLNIGNCYATVLQAILNGMLQGLNQP